MESTDHKSWAHSLHLDKWDLLCENQWSQTNLNQFEDSAAGLYCFHQNSAFQNSFPSDHNLHSYSSA